jgi:hypothetical protein
MLLLFGIGQVVQNRCELRARNRPPQRAFTDSPVETESLFDRSYESLHVGVVMWRAVNQAKSIKSMLTIEREYNYEQRHICWPVEGNAGCA